MAGNEPFEQLAGITLKVYVAPVGETLPEPDASPAGNWVWVGNTDGDQTLEHKGALTYFSDNEHQGKVKAIRPEEEKIFSFTLVGLTLENMARVLDRVADVTGTTKKHLPSKRGRFPNEYAMIMRSDVLSPYGAFEGQYVVPRGVFDGEPKETYTRDGRSGFEMEFHALEDDTQADADSLGWLEVLTS